MTSFSKIFILPFVALAFASQTGAAPLEKRDIFSPPVLYPHSGTEWYHGQRHNITWDTSNPPANITDKTGEILLWQGGRPTTLILAKGFDILAGRVEVEVPWVQTRSDYAVSLLGDSGNVGQTFTIHE